MDSAEPFIVLFAEKIVRVVEDSALREHLLAEGERVLAALPSPRRKYELLVSYMREILSRERA